jgi:hypothetical protein
VKYFFFLVSIVLVGITRVVAQPVSLNELLRLRSLDYSEFETAVSQKGYQYLNSTQDDNAVIYEFTRRESEGLTNKYLIYSISNDSKSVHVNYQTSLISEYNALKQAAIKSGYAYKESGRLVDRNAFYVTYKKGLRELMFISASQAAATEKNTSNYEVLIN